MELDSAGLWTIISFAIPMAAGAATVRWPQHAWIAGIVFWLSLTISICAAGLWVVSNWGWLMAAWGPRFLIGIGLFIAAAGLAWDILRAPQPKNISPTQNFLQTQPTPAPTYNERDLRDILNALADASSLLETKVGPAITATLSQTANWRYSITTNGAKQFADSMNELRNKIASDIWNPINHLVYEKHGRLKDDLRFILVLEHEGTKDQVSRAIDAATQTLEHVSAKPSEGALELIKPKFEEAYKQAVVLHNWYALAKDRISRIEGELRKTSTFHRL